MITNLNFKNLIFSYNYGYRDNTKSSSLAAFVEYTPKNDISTTIKMSNIQIDNNFVDSGQSYFTFEAVNVTFTDLDVTNNGYAF